MQLENDAAALLLVCRALQLKATAARAGDSGNMTGARNKMQQTRTYRAAAGRLVLNDRPPSLGVPTWLDAGVQAG